MDSNETGTCQLTRKETQGHRETSMVITSYNNILIKKVIDTKGDVDLGELSSL